MFEKKKINEKQAGVGQLKNNLFTFRVVLLLYELQKLDKKTHFLNFRMFVLPKDM